MDKYGLLLHACGHEIIFHRINLQNICDFKVLILYSFLLKFEKQEGT